MQVRALEIVPRRPQVAARAVGFGALLMLAACGLLGSKEPEAAADPCPRVDPPARQLAGALIRQPKDVGLYEVLAIEGRTSRAGAISRLALGDYTFKARAAPDGGLEGRRGARAEPISEVSGVVPGIFAFAVSYRHGGQDLAGRLTVGKPTPGSRLPTSGEARYRGPVRLTVQSATLAEPLQLGGTADIAVRFGSRQVEMSFGSLAPATGGTAGELPFAKIDWTGIGMCGARLGSNGQGGFRTSDAGGRVVNFAGPGAGSPDGSAVLNAGFIGVADGTAQPAGIGGVLLIQGDSGVVSGVFAAGPAK